MNKLISSYDVLEDMKKVASNYFDVDEAQLRTGMFATVVESISKIAEHGLLYAMINSREKFVSTAKRYETLLLEAALYGIDAVQAIPSRMDVFLGIPIDDILSSCKVIDGEFTITLKRDAVIYISGYEFMPEYDIKIIGRRDNETSPIVWRAILVMDDRFPIAVTKNPYIVTSRRKIDGLEYLMMSITCRQVSKTYTDHIILENDDVSLLGMEFEYTGQLTHYNIYYKEFDSTVYKKIKAVNYLSSQKIQEEHLLVNSSEPGILTMYSNPAYFRPSLNSEILVEIYTTTGKDAIFSTENAIAAIKLLSYGDEYDYSGLRPVVFTITDSIGGMNMTELEDLRNNVIYHKSTLDVLLTANDLMQYFSRLNAIDTMYFVEKRSDILERRFSGFMIPRAKDNAIISTLTTNIAVKKTDFDKYDTVRNYGILLPSRLYSRFGSLYNVSYDADVIEYIENYNWDGYIYPRPLNEILTDADKRTMSDHPQTLLISSPYLIRVGLDSKSVGFFDNSINIPTIQINPIYATDKTPDHLLSTTMSINRAAVKGESAYTVKFRVSATYDLPTSVIDDEGNLLDLDYVKAKVIAYDGTSIIGHVNCVLSKYDPNSKLFYFTCSLNTEDYLSDNNKLLITNMVRASATVSDIQEPPTAVNSTDLTLGVGLFVKSAIVDTNNPITIALGNGYPGYILTNIYSNIDEKISLFRDVTAHIKSIIAYDENIDTYVIREIPMVNHIAIIEKNDELFSSIKRTINIMDTIKYKVVNNFYTDFKFYKTYGPSLYFKINDTLSIDRLTLKLGVKLHMKPLIREDLTVIDTIKVFIKQYIENINFETKTSTLFISNMITAVETKFTDSIYSAEVIHVNEMKDPLVPTKNLVVTNITYNPPDMTKLSHTQVRDFVPEYLNIELKDIDLQIVQY